MLSITPNNPGAARKPPTKGSEKEVNLDRAHVRVALHELVRVWVGRHEDWTLLESVERGELNTSFDTLQQLLRECELREEARTKREEVLLQEVNTKGGCNLQVCVPQEPKGQGTKESIQLGRSELGKKKEEKINANVATTRGKSNNPKTAFSGGKSPYKCIGRAAGAKPRHARRATSSGGIGEKPGNGSLAKPLSSTGDGQPHFRPASAPQQGSFADKQIFGLLDLQKQFFVNVATHKHEDGSERMHEVLQMKIDNAHRAIVHKLACLQQGVKIDTSGDIPACLSMVDLGVTRAEAHQRLALKAALLIQRSWRNYCRCQEIKKRIRKDLQEREDRILAERHAAATKIQCCVRGWLARLQYIRLRAREIERKRTEMLQRVRNQCCAIRIQRAFRDSRKTAVIQKMKLFTKEVAFDYRGTESESEAATVIQAYVRRWLVQQNPQLRWKQTVREMRRRRQDIQHFKEHESNMSRLSDAEEQVFRIRAKGQQIMEDISEQFREERKSFEQAWGRWLKSLKGHADHVPLPKGWVVRKDQMTLQKVYFDLTNMQLHTVHPVLASLQPFVEKERRSAEVQFADRVQPLMRYARSIRDAIEASEVKVCQELVSCISMSSNKVGLM